MSDASLDCRNFLPNKITDEAAYVLSGLLHDLAQACGEKYYAQIRRHADHLMVVPGRDKKFCDGSENKINHPDF